MSPNFEITITPIRAKHSSEVNYNFIKKNNNWRWSDSETNTSEIGDYFIFRFHNKKVIIHKIIDIKGPEYKLESWENTKRNTLMLSPPIKELEWDMWSILDPPKKWMGSYRTVNLKNKWPLVYKELLKTPTASIISELIIHLNTNSDYSETIDDKNYLSINTCDSLWFIIYCFNGFNGQWRNDLRKMTNDSRSLLLGYNCSKDNIDLYPRKILYDYRKISQEYDRWDHEYCGRHFELNILTGNVSSYCHGNRLKENCVLLDSKRYKWEFYEKTQYSL